MFLYVRDFVPLIDMRSFAWLLPTLGRGFPLPIALSRVTSFMVADLEYGRADGRGFLNVLPSLRFYKILLPLK